MVTLLLLLLATSAPPFPPGFHDRPGVDENGAEIVIRSGLWPDFAGGEAVVEQVLVPNPDGSFNYRYAAQSRATRIYHHTLCAQHGQYPSEGDAVSSGAGTYGGWACERVIETIVRPPDSPAPAPPPGY